MNRISIQENMAQLA